MLIFFSASRLKTFERFLSCSFRFRPNTIISSLMFRTPCNLSSAVLSVFWNTSAAEEIPKFRLLYCCNPIWVEKVEILHESGCNSKLMVPSIQIKCWERSTVKAANKKNSLVLCHLKTLSLYTGFFKFELDHYLTNVARVKSRYWGWPIL